MKIYEDNSTSPDGWNVSSTLKLTDDGRFSYSEGWTDYTNASLSGGAAGTWRRGVRAIAFRVEEVYPPIYFPWVKGQELIARLRDGDLDFGNGWRLCPPSTELWEYVIKTPVSNTGAQPLTLVVEPWGIRRTLAPGERVQVVAKGAWGEGKPRVERRPGEVVYDGRNGSWATVVPEPPLPPSTPQPEPKPKSSTPPRARRATAPKPVAGQQGMSPVEPLPRPPAPRFVPRAPSPELAVLMRRWIDELPSEVLVNRVQRLCKENDAIPLDANQFEVWALRTDGQVLYIEHDSSAQRAEPVEDAEVAYGRIEVGMKKYPELLELLPPDRGWPGSDTSSWSR
jgi:hypothetical protein